MGRGGGRGGKERGHRYRHRLRIQTEHTRMSNERVRACVRVRDINKAREWETSTLLT